MTDDENDIHAIDRKFLELLVCPVSHTALIYDAQKRELISKASGLAYPVRDNIPILLPDEARRLDKDNPD